MKKITICLLIMLLLTAAVGCGRLGQEGQDKKQGQTEVNPPDNSGKPKVSEGQDKTLAELEKALKDLERLLNELDVTEESDYVEEGTN